MSKPDAGSRFARDQVPVLEGNRGQVVKKFKSTVG